MAVLLRAAAQHMSALPAAIVRLTPTTLPTPRIRTKHASTVRIYIVTRTVPSTRTVHITRMVLGARTQAPQRAPHAARSPAEWAIILITLI